MTPSADDKKEQAKPVENGDAAAPMKTEEPAAPEQSDAQKVAAQLAANLALIEKSVKQKETRMGSGRLLRTTAAIRRKLSRAILQQFISSSLPEDSAMRPVLLAVLEQVNPLRCAYRKSFCHACRPPLHPAFTVCWLCYACRMIVEVHQMLAHHQS